MNEQKVKDLLKQARLLILDAQFIIRPTDERWKLINEIIEPLEEMIENIKLD
jgi:hypothetical protein